MKKKAITVLLAVLCFCFLCGCSFKVSTARENLEKSGYTITVFTDEKIESLNTSMASYKAKGGIVSGIYAENSQGYFVQVIEFENKSDLEIMYKQLKNGAEKIDFSGNVLVYGDYEAVKTAMK